jgi:nucleotide-binding universal stress UspA family protein
MTRPDVPHDFSDPATCILHPTDLSPDSDLALAHALRVALMNKADLILLHVCEEDDQEHFPSIRKVLQRWGQIEPGASRSAVTDLGIGVEKISAHGPNVVDAISNFLHFRPVDMLVMATEGRHGLSSWFHPSMAEQTARKTEVPTLFVPTDCRGCVSLEGEVSLAQILVPVDHQPPSEAAVQRGLRALSALGDDKARLRLLHIGDETQFPHVDLALDGWEIARVTRQGNPVTEILEEAAECNADLLIMTTEGRDGFYDVLRGTTTEQVLRRAPCPLLAVPAIC